MPFHLRMFLQHGNHDLMLGHEFKKYEEIAKSDSVFAFNYWSLTIVSLS